MPKPEKAEHLIHYKEGSQPYRLPANIRPGWKGFPGTNAVAYQRRWKEEKKLL